MFASRRRRKSSPDAHGSSSTLLPTTTKVKPLAFQGGSNTCNNFLLGGQFYPGKDKKRKHLRRRTLWHRICCSTPWRAFVSLIVLVYIATYHVLIPSTHFLLRKLSGSNHGFLEQPPFHLPSVSQQRMEATRLRQERLGIQFSSSERRHDAKRKVLEHIVPDWFHRNDNVYEEKSADTIESNDKESDDEIAHERQQHPGSKAQAPKKRPGQDIKVEEKPKQRRHASVNKTVSNEVKKSEKVDSKQNKTAHADRAEKHAKEEDPSDKGKKSEHHNTTDKAIDTKKKTAVVQPIRRTLQNMDSLPSTSSCPATLSAEDIQTTLVIQSSLERLWILNETCSRWKSPIVVVVHLPHKGGESLPEILEACPQVTLVTHQAHQEEAKWAYPVNRLRNLGLDAVRTSHVLVADIDFLPSQNLDQLITSTIVEQQAFVNSSEPQAMVVPAFERIPPEPCSKQNDCSAYLKTNSSFIPSTLEELRHCAIHKECSVFQLSNNWEGHYSTRSESWLKGVWYETPSNSSATNTTNHGPIRTIKCFDSLRYEPYVVLRWCPVSSGGDETSPVAPYYDERFYGYGKNKIQLISHIRFMGYHFSVLPKGFLVHNPHVESLAKETWNDIKRHNIHQEMDALYPEFLEELWNRYKDTTKYIVQQCKRKKKR